MLRRLIRSTVLLHWCTLIVLEALAIATIVVIRVERLPIARLLHARGMSEPRALRTTRLLLIASLLLPYLMFLVSLRISLALMRRLRRKLDCCLNCDYDLTNNTTGICPECGTPLEPSLWPPPPPSNAAHDS